MFVCTHCCIVAHTCTPLIIAVVMCCMFAARHNTSLQSITLDGCVQLTDEAFIHLGRGAKHATLVAAQGCGKLTNGGFGPLARGCKHLKALNLSYCGGVNNEALIVVAKALKQLELFHCAFCTDVTDAGTGAGERGAGEGGGAVGGRGQGEALGSTVMFS